MQREGSGRQASSTLFVATASVWGVSGLAWAQDPTTPEPEPEPAPEPEPEPEPDQPVVDLRDQPTVIQLCGDGDCCPPSTAQQVMVGVGTLVFTVMAAAFLMWMGSRRYIEQARNPRIGQQYGLTLALIFGIGFMFLLIRLITGCLPTDFYLWLGLFGFFLLAQILFSFTIKD